MSNEYCAVNRVVLRGQHTVLTAQGMESGIFADFESETGRIDAEWIARLLTAVGMPLRPQPKNAVGSHFKVDRISKVTYFGGFTVEWAVPGNVA